MPVDIEAAVIANRRLSADYNVLSLAAPEIAATARPGQFVMIKTSGGQDPLLRRPFSIFEILRDDDGAPATSRSSRSWAAASAAATAAWSSRVASTAARHITRAPASKARSSTRSA
jgi:hypothetical protein